MIHNHWLSIIQYDSQPLAQLSTPWFTTTVSSYRTMIHNHCLRIKHHDSLNQWLWIAICYSEPVVVNRGELCCALGCESCCVILSRWLWIMVFYSETVVVNHGAIWWNSGCESWCAMLSQWLWITVCYSEPVAQHDSYPLAQNNTPWFTTTGSE
jgi:hypothetical protein